MRGEFGETRAVFVAITCVERIDVDGRLMLAASSHGIRHAEFLLILGALETGNFYSLMVLGALVHLFFHGAEATQTHAHFSGGIPPQSDEDTHVRDEMRSQENSKAWAPRGAVVPALPLYGAWSLAGLS